MNEIKGDCGIRKYICINCGQPVKNLFKKYSATVLKLTECENCGNIADKYVEYDVVIIIIDLVLLQKIAYRHVIHNGDFKVHSNRKYLSFTYQSNYKHKPISLFENYFFNKFCTKQFSLVDKLTKHAAIKNFWKLSVILLLMEAYAELMQNRPIYHEKDEEKPFLNEFEEIVDFLFYKLSWNVALKSLCFITVLYLLTRIYCFFVQKIPISFVQIWKSLTVSGFGIFLLLPSLVWDTSVQEFHLGVVSLYTTLSQLLAYTVACDCPKIWSIFSVFFAYYCKSYCLDVFEFTLSHTIKTEPY